MSLKKRELLRERVLEDDALYEKFGKPLEEKHWGEFVAIGRDGRTIVGKDQVAVVQAAIQSFGSGQFALRRIGFKAIGKWR
jgi:hypothetical protein